MTESSDRSPRISAAAQVAVGERETGFWDYLRVISKRRWVAAASFLLVLVFSIVYTFTRTPIYEARVTLLIESENPNFVDFKEVVQEGQGRGDYYATRYGFLQSRSLARRTLDRLDLLGSSYFGGGPKPASAGAGDMFKRSTDWFRGLFSNDDALAAEPRGADETQAQTTAIDAFLGGLTITPVRNSRLVTLQYRSADPTQATNIANTLAQLYIDQNLEFKFLTSKEASDWLSGQLAEQRLGQEFPTAALLRIKHMLFSHHGTYEYGSPKLPMTPEAIALHHLDNLDAKVNEFSTLISSDPNSQSSWTPYQATMQRKIYKGGG